MSAMMASKRNRIRYDVDNPIDSDGFYRFKIFKGNRAGGAATGNRSRRRVIRTKKNREWRSEIRNDG